MRPGSAEVAIEVASLRVQRGRNVVFDALDLSIPAGKSVGLLGPSGSGKTTLMRAIVGVQKIASGSVTVLGEPAGSPALRRSVSYDTQTASVYDDLTVVQNLRYFARILGLSADEVSRVIEEVDLGDQSHQLAGSLSGGQRSRVSLAVAMIGSPQLLILDEPTVGLDPVLRASLWDLFHTLTARGVSVLVSSHVMDEALRCDEVVLLHQGRVLAQTTPQSLLSGTDARDPDTAFLRLIEREGGERP